MFKTVPSHFVLQNIPITVEQEPSLTFGMLYSRLLQWLFLLCFIMLWIQYHIAVHSASHTGPLLLEEPVGVLQADRQDAIAGAVRVESPASGLTSSTSPVSSVLFRDNEMNQTLIPGK